ncbi:GntR family transcriptional regulator [Streptomyces acidiscabies]|uniref:GntR family transcriptional regulator n=1 Tax=Streptomyces acidiscabies TaxID=42234 RepID=UPI00067C18D8|nr:GntR family transcriptional regulator [Streptomyces acidiscabies]
MRGAGLAEGAHVTEQRAADELEASRTPVRKAMHFLAEIGILDRVPNRGYFLTRDASELTGPGPGDSPEDAAYFEPADDHVGGRLERPFTSADVARRYRLTPRQAERVLARMTAEDLVRRRRGGRAGSSSTSWRRSTRTTRVTGSR